MNNYVLKYMKEYAILKIEKGVEMEQKKNKNRLIILLAVLVVILTVLCALFATGTISFKNFTINNNNQSNGDVVDSNIDLYDLEEIYDTLGIDKNETRSLKHCLNYNLSSNNYLENSKKIFSLYVILNGYNVTNIPLEEQQKIMYCDVVKSDDCSGSQPFFSPAAARVISKPRANIVISKYNLQDTDFLMDFPHISNYVDDMYGYFTEYASGGGCDYIIKHNLDIEENEAHGVTVVDKQTVKKLKYDEEKLKYVYDNEINQTVTYVLKGEYDTYHYVYYLDSVSVK